MLKSKFGKGDIIEMIDQEGTGNDCEHFISGFLINMAINCGNNPGKAENFYNEMRALGLSASEKSIEEVCLRYGIVLR